MDPGADAIALLPGSRPHEVRRLARPMLGALGRLRRGRAELAARVLVAPSIAPGQRAWLARMATELGVPLVDVDPLHGAGALLNGFDAAISASGTATLECALAGAPPVVVYRMGALSAALARRLVRTPHIALPNVVLGRRCYPELVQDAAHDALIARSMAAVLDDRRSFVDAASELRRRLAIGNARGPRTAVERAAALLSDWLGIDPDGGAIGSIAQQAGP
jgi:lipid-A-disaccharide synthase